MSNAPSDSEFASSPCSWHEFDGPANAGAGGEPPADVAAWRVAERKRQIEARQGISLPDRAALAARMVDCLEQEIVAAGCRTVSLYWPIRGEPDLRPLIARLVAKQLHCALPVVTARQQALEFFSWAPGEPLKPGFWNIPVPTAGERVEPELLLAPLVAFDRAGYRLGYGGGYFDRTLAALPGRRTVLGVGYAAAAIDSIFPQPHDIAMDAIVTEHGVRGR